MALVENRADRISWYAGFYIGVTAVASQSYLVVLTLGGPWWWYLPTFLVSIAGIFLIWKRRPLGMIALALGGVFYSLLVFLMLGAEASYRDTWIFGVTFLIFGAPTLLSVALIWSSGVKFGGTR